MIQYAVEVPSWRDPAGKLWEPYSTVSLLAPDAMVYSSYDFIIQEIEFTKTSKMEKAILTLVVPGAYSSKLPEKLPWD
jgi:prophage tail gpP-like protein